MMPAMSTLTIELPERLRQQLVAAARRAGKTPRRFVRETLEASLSNGGHARNGRSLFDQSQDLCGSLEGGPRDLSSNKDYLKRYGS